MRRSFLCVFALWARGIVVRGSSVCVARAGICEWGVYRRRRGVVCVARDRWGAGYVGWLSEYGTRGARTRVVW